MPPPSPKRKWSKSKCGKSVAHDKTVVAATFDSSYKFDY